MHATKITQPDLPDGRQSERTHLFLAASLYSKAGSCPVHVRNISSTGAQIEGSIVPEPGDQLTLKRGSLEASGRIVWKAGRKAGVAFGSAIFVADWMARQPSAHQGRVDGIVHAIRSASTDRSEEAPEARPIATLSTEAELLGLKATLTELEKGLIGDVVLVATHPEIQLLDIALQAVERMLRAERAR